jgi:tripartite-type tricarboxylate transporter receptor subunit TctC
MRFKDLKIKTQVPTHHDRRRWLQKLIALTSPLLVGKTLAQADTVWPTKPIRVIVPFPAGGVVDLVARAVCDRLAMALQQPFIVEPKPGASGNIGAAFVSAANPDGYTLLAGTPAVLTQPLLAGSTAKHKLADFRGVGLIGAPPNIFVVSPVLAVRSLKELVELARDKPNQLNVTNPGIGTSNHLGQELFFSVTKIAMTNVRYPGQPQMLPDLTSGQVHFGLVTEALAKPLIREGKLRALAISAPSRSPELPEVPTIAEAGYASSLFLPWYGLMAPAKTPDRVVKRLSEEIQSALRQAEVITRLEKLGTLLTPGSAESFDRLLIQEQETWTRVINERGMRAA